MSTTYILVDYHNFHKERIKRHPRPIRRPRVAQDTVDWVITEMTATLASLLKRIGQSPSVLHIRLYGGWHSGAVPTNDAHMVEAAIKKVPRRSTSSPARLVFELAKSLIDLPHIPILDTLRPRTSYPRFIVHSPIAHCHSTDNCSLLHTESVLKQQVCTTQGCSVTIEEATSIMEQKCIDILLSSDLLSLSSAGSNVILVTEDLDLVPAVLKAQISAKSSLIWLCDSLSKSSYYLPALETLGVKVEPVTA
jgi:hypothetical protein